MQAGMAVSSAASPFDANPIAATTTSHLARQQRRQSHRSSSISSSSAATVQRPGSLTKVGFDSAGGESSLDYDHKRRRSVAIDPSDSYVNDRASVASVNRLSHSTSSSISSTNRRRNRSSSGAVLSSVVGQSFSPRQKPFTALEASLIASPQRRNGGSNQKSLADSPTRSRRTSRSENVTALPPLHTTPALTDPNDTESPASNQTVQTPSAYSSYIQDGYFNGDVEYGLGKPKRMVMVRNSTAPPPTNNHNKRAGGLENHEAHRDTATSSMHTIDMRLPKGPGEGTRRPRHRERVEKDKKSMLSKALQKANTAVLLDNAQNYEGALEAYSDACNLLTQVMNCTSGEDDKRKLDAIRVTYSNRMEELRLLVQDRPLTVDEKHLPARPMSDDSLSSKTQSVVPISPINGAVQSSILTNPAGRKITDAPRLSYPRNVRDSFFERTMQAVESSANISTPDLQDDAAAGFEDSTPHPAEVTDPSVHLPPLEHSEWVPRPLSPKRPSASTDAQTPDEGIWQMQDDERDGVDSKDATSWLDTIEESGSSCSDSVHSVDDQRGMRRKHIRGASGGTDPDFDAAFDAAVEAAYDEGFEPDLEARRKRMTALRQEHNDSRQVPAFKSNGILPAALTTNNVPGLEPEDEEEERILNEFTQDYGQGFNFDLRSKSALPRQSDSSGYSRSTWQSSQLSDRATNATSLSTVAEDGLASRMSNHTGTGLQARHRNENTSALLPPPPPPPPSAINSTPPPVLPPPGAPPTAALPLPPSADNSRMASVRSRRLSGMNPKQLKIETSPNPPEGRKRASTFHHSASPFGEDEEHDASAREDRLGERMETTPSDIQHDSILLSPPSLHFRSALDDMTKSIDEPTLEYRPSYEEVPTDMPATRPTLFRKNKSSISLRGHAEHTLLLASPDAEAGFGTLPTPMSSTFANFAAAKRAQDPLRSQRANLPSFGPALDGRQSDGGIYLFDTSLSADNHQVPMSPRSPVLSPLPAGLEPCPESFLLRPFWLVRALQQTIAHPRGGFLTTKLFVPREVWQTRGVKLKLVEDKIAMCDLLTAALGRLAGADTYDADAIADELQSFEEVMEKVQTTLAKKLGNDVGVHGVAGILKDASATAAASATGHAHASESIAAADKGPKSNSGKSYLSSWRKLRSKSSGTSSSSNSGVHAHQSSSAAKAIGGKEQHTIPSVPMTSFVPVERRGNRREVRNMAFEGPNKEYMGSLARLFDGVQVLDQIARQVEDPGLKHSSPTHVGLELSIRHAAEFFGFYVCRFVLADLGLLMDKFVKRGTEWVLA